MGSQAYTMYIISKYHNYSVQVDMNVVAWLKINYRIVSHSQPIVNFYHQLVEFRLLIFYNILTTCLQSPDLSVNETERENWILTFVWALPFEIWWLPEDEIHITKILSR